MHLGRRLAVASALALLLASCGGAGDRGGNAAPLRTRIDQIGAQVEVWAAANDLASAQAAAEAAANLVTGSGGPEYGDRDGDGTVDGEAEVGVLPSLDGDSVGLALPLRSESCELTDVLGGSWDDPGARWQTFEDALTEWRPDNNTFPSLPSHAQRVVGWASLTIASDDLDTAHEYAGHAALHVDVMRRAIQDC